MPLLEPDGDLDGLHLDSEDLPGQDGRGARILDCTVTQVTLDDVRLGRAQIVDTSLTGVGAATLTLTEATLRDVVLTDLVGATLRHLKIAGTTIDPDQLAVLAPALAAHLRITVTDAPR